MVADIRDTTMDLSDKIIRFYQDNPPFIDPRKRPLPEEALSASSIMLINEITGLGDTLSVLHIPELAYRQKKIIRVGSNGPHFQTLVRFNPYCQRPPRTDRLDEIAIGVVPCYRGPRPARLDEKMIGVVDLHTNYDMGNGHLFQQIQRTLDLDIQLAPKATLVVEGITPKKNRVALNFNTGTAQDQKRLIHPRARELYEEHRASIQRFILDHQSTYEFVEFGTFFSGLEGVNNRVGLPLEKTIQELAGCEFYFAMHSGLMHVAAALRLKSIIIINFPEAKRLYLPSLHDLGLVDLEWLYPQNVHLHEDGEGELVKKLSYENIQRAFNGELYPFFEDKHLELVNHHWENSGFTRHRVRFNRDAPRFSVA